MPRTKTKSNLGELYVLVKRRENILVLAREIRKRSRTVTDENANLFRAQLKHLEGLEKDFEEVQSKIIHVNSQVDDIEGVDVNETSLQFYDLVYEIRAAVPIDRSESSREVVKAAPAGTSPLPIAPVQIPPFDGTSSAWRGFKSLYDQLIHQNTAFSNVQKLYHLKLALRGEAAKLIDDLDLTEENYSIAYEALIRRYASQRRIANRYMCNIINFQASGTERDYLSVHENAVSSLKAMKIPDLADYVLFRCCYENLSSKMKYLFDDRSDSNNIPTCRELFDFVLHHTQNAELRRDAQPGCKTESQAQPRIQRNMPRSLFIRKDSAPQVVKKHDRRTSRLSCPICSKEHLIYACVDFLKMSITERQDTINRLERCSNCLGGHGIQNCTSQKTCNKCGQQHHSFLHSEPDHPSSVIDTQNPISTPRCHFVNFETSSTVILGTFLAQIQDSSGEYHQIRCVMDPGSHISAISKPCVNKLKLKTRKVDYTVSGLDESSCRTEEMLNVSIRSCQDDQKVFKCSAYVFPTVCHQLPSQRVNIQTRLKHIEGLELADPYYDEPGPVDLLLSAEMSAAILSKETPNLVVGRPTAMRTAFGWVLYGAIPASSEQTQAEYQNLFTFQNDLQKFWEIEEVTPLESPVSPEDDWCEQHFIQTHFRDPTGRYVVALPFRLDNPPLGDNREHSMKRWIRLEKKLSTCSNTKSAYNSVLQEYMDKNHMTIASVPSKYILPHHAVMKVSSSTKLRVVFDASSPDSRGLSLNDRLFVGPKLQRDIRHIIFAFRFFRVALCGDISQMYRMIWLHPNDCAYQHIFWRKSPTVPVEEYELRTLTFGLAPAPFLAQRVIKQLVKDEGKPFPEASKVLEDYTYIDDVITGANSIEEGRILQDQLITLLAKGGFHLRKWSSNASELLETVSREDREQPLEFDDGSLGFKILGLYWNPQSDAFTYQVQPFKTKATKRTISSFIARIFDPMGWLAPVTVLAKQFLQRLWLQKLDWDAEVPEPLLSQWLTYSQQFEALNTLKISRQVNIYDDNSIITGSRHYRLLGFCDASETAYAACIYLQTLGQETHQSILMQAKTKIAPLKSRTIPCLELCGALLLVKLIKAAKFPTSEPLDIWLFTDSQIVLTWLRTPLHRLKTFISNRVAQILELSQISQWKHISGSDNPADIASRGLYPKEMLKCNIWWHGPKKLTFLDEILTLPEAETPELKVNKKGYTYLLTKPMNEMIAFLEKFSSWTKLRRTVAWVLRFCHNCRKTNSRYMIRWLASQELKNATLRITRLLQMHYFNSEIQDIQNNQLPKYLKSLDPFLDKSGCLRVGGRLRHSQLGFDAKHPLLLPRESHVTKLIVRHYHEVSLHSGITTVQARIQHEFWIPSLRNLLKSITFQCIRCHRLKAATLQPKMGDLPPERVTVARPFAHTAVDFAGPFSMKESTRRNSKILKCYLCVFICMATKAVHLEIVTALTTEAFLATFSRFVSRRGLPATVLSDNGRNFVGAARELKSLKKWLLENEGEIGSSLASKSIVWKFNPPEAPNFGGLFEAAVKSAKTLLRRLVGEQPFTFEEYSTLVQKIEAILNSRPLTKLNTDPNDDYLAPSHFLIGGLLHQVPEQPPDNTTLHSRWKRVQQLSQAFWKRWSSQYLQQLIQRSKWQKDDVTLQLGDLVYIKNQTTSPLTWPLGRIIETFPGPDGIVRVVRVRTSGGSYIRPATKLVRLPLD